MTTLLSWVSFSDTGESSELPRAIYLASDSRISWGSSENRWEAGRKVFAPSREPHLFGYCGDVVLPALMLGQIVSAIDARVLFEERASVEARHQAVFNAVEQGVARAIATPTLDFTIHHLVRDHEWPKTSFRAWTISYNARNRSCRTEELLIPATTQVIGSFGSGRTALGSHQWRWEGSDASGRSRSIFSAFCDAIASGDDPFSGGPPQVAALYTKGAPVTIGTYVEGLRYINGMQLEGTTGLSQIEWRDRLGQVVDPITGRVAAGARRFGRPKNLPE